VYDAGETTTDADRDRLQTVFHRLSEVRPDWDFSQARVVGAGIEGLVVDGQVPGFGRVAIKIPRERWHCSGNDDRVDTRLLLEQEFEIARHFHELGLPVPKPFELFVSDDFDFLASEFVENDGNGMAVDIAELGALVGKLHGLPSPELELVCAEGVDIDILLARRISDRLERLRERTEIDFPRVDVEGLLRSSPQEVESRLLHMDVRPANVLVRAGHIAAIVDWSNALYGEPSLELARIAEYGHLDTVFMKAYDRLAEKEVMEATAPARLCVYRLDTAVMLSHVFLAQVPDDQRAVMQLARVRELLRELDS